MPWGPVTAPQRWAHQCAMGSHHCTPKVGALGCCGVPLLHPKTEHIGVPLGPVAAPQGQVHQGVLGCHCCTPKLEPIRVPWGPVGPGGVRATLENLGPWRWCPPGRPGPCSASPGVTGVTGGGGAPPAARLPAPPLRASVSPPAAPWKVGNFQCVGPGGAGCRGGRMPGGPRRPYNARPRRPRHHRCHAR